MTGKAGYAQFIIDRRTKSHNIFDHLADWVNLVGYETIENSYTRGEITTHYTLWYYVASLANPAESLDATMKNLKHFKGVTPDGLADGLVQKLNKATLIPTDPMPWWLLKHKASKYWVGDRLDFKNLDADVTLSFGVVSQGPPTVSFAKRRSCINAVTHYIRNLPAPPLPESAKIGIVKRYR